MNRNKTIHAVFGAMILLLTGLPVFSQGDVSEVKGLYFRLAGSYYPTDSRWEFEHPLLGTGVTIWETVDGTYSGGFSFEGGVERRWAKCGIELLGGFKASTIIVNEGESIEVGEIYNFMTNFLGIEGYLYPGPGGKRIEPIIGLGVGFVKLTGDSKTGGALISIGGGIGYNPVDRIRISAGAELKRIYLIDYVESERENQAYDRTIHVTPVVLKVSVAYQAIKGQ